MPLIVRSLINESQTLDGQVLAPWATQTRPGPTTALTNAAAAKTIQLDDVADDSAEEARLETVAAIAPLTGETYTVPDNAEVVLVNQAGTIAAWTVNMPVNPYPGQRVNFAFREIVTALTMSAGAGKFIRGALTAAAANGFATWRFRSSDNTWYRVG